MNALTFLLNIRRKISTNTEIQFPFEKSPSVSKPSKEKQIGFDNLFHLPSRFEMSRPRHRLHAIYFMHISTNTKEEFLSETNIKFTEFI